MLTYNDIRADRREFLALAGLTDREFRLLLDDFARAYERAYPADRTLSGQPRHRLAGGGRKATLRGPEQKLLFILVYVKTYPPQVLMARLFGLSQPGVNGWIHRLLPVLREALAARGDRPARAAGDSARARPSPAAGPPRLIIDGTERRRQRPKNPGKQALHYSGKKKAHTDKNVLVADARRKRVGFLSRTYAGTAHDKGMADHEAIVWPPGAVLYEDAGFQGYEPAGVAETRRPEKKAARRTVVGRGEAGQPDTVARPRPGGTRHRRREALPHCERRPAEY